MYYFIIQNNGGDTNVSMVEKGVFERRMNDHYYGDAPIFLDKMPDNSDTNMWPEYSMLVIKGDIAPPTEKKVVTTWEAG